MHCNAWSRANLHSALVAIVAFCMACPLHCTPEAACTAASPHSLITGSFGFVCRRFKPAEAEAKQKAFEEEQRRKAEAAQNGGSRGKGKKAAPAAA